jgi:hypothetical protein
MKVLHVITLAGLRAIGFSRWVHYWGEKLALRGRGVKVKNGRKRRPRDDASLPWGMLLDRRGTDST